MFLPTGEFRFVFILCQLRHAFACPTPDMPQPHEAGGAASERPGTTPREVSHGPDH
jgi:hypothetical protein